MDKMVSLPDTEFEVMKVLWGGTPPLSANTVMEKIGQAKGWKVQTAISLLLRLVERGFVRTEKRGKERLYYPLVAREDYLRFETGNFLRLYHENSVASLVGTLYGGRSLNEAELAELAELLKGGENR